MTKRRELLVLAVLLISFFATPLWVYASVPECKVDIDLVLDRSGSMADFIDGLTKLDLVKQSSARFVNRILNSSSPYYDNLMGLTIFNHNVESKNALTNDGNSVIDNINGLSADGATNYNESIRMGVDNLTTQGRAGVKKYVLFLSDGKPTVPNSKKISTGGATDPEDIASAYEAANYAASKEIPLMTVGFGKKSNLDETLLQGTANITLGKYYYANTSNGLDAVYEDILNEVCTNHEDECEDDIDCDDGGVCTLDSCDKENGKCKHDDIENCCLLDECCDDQNSCTDDVCLDNRCVHNEISNCCTTNEECDDQDVCTSDVCLDNRCQHYIIQDDSLCAECQTDDDCNNLDRDYCDGNIV